MLVLLLGSGPKTCYGFESRLFECRAPEMAEQLKLKRNCGFNINAYDPSFFFGFE